MTQPYAVTLSSKGQLTLPAAVRPHFGRVADLAGLPAARRVDLTPAEMRALAHEDRWREQEARGS